MTYGKLSSSELNYLEVLFVGHLQGDNISTTRTVSVSSSGTPNCTNNCVFDSNKESCNTTDDPPFESTNSLESNDHLVRLTIVRFGSTYKIVVVNR